MCFGKEHPYKQLRTSLKHQNQEHFYYDVSKLNPQLFAQLPFCLRILLESTVRQCNNLFTDHRHVEQILHWQTTNQNTCELPFLPSRIIMHDFSGLPAIIDLAAMRDAAVRLCDDPDLIQPQIPTTLLLDYYNIEADVAKKLCGRQQIRLMLLVLNVVMNFVHFIKLKQFVLKQLREINN